MNEIIKLVIVGAAIAAIWFYFRSLMSSDLSFRAVYKWMTVIIPISMLISGGLKAIGVI